LGGKKDGGEELCCKTVKKIEERKLVQGKNSKQSLVGKRGCKDAGPTKGLFSEGGEGENTKEQKGGYNKN